MRYETKRAGRVISWSVDGASRSGYYVTDERAGDAVYFTSLLDAMRYADRQAMNERYAERMAAL